MTELRFQLETPPRGRNDPFYRCKIELRRDGCLDITVQEEWEAQGVALAPAEVEQLRQMLNAAAEKPHPVEVRFAPAEEVTAIYLDGKKVWESSQDDHPPRSSSEGAHRHQGDP